MDHLLREYAGANESGIAQAQALLDAMANRPAIEIRRALSRNHVAAKKLFAAMASELVGDVLLETPMANFEAARRTLLVLAQRTATDERARHALATQFFARVCQYGRPTGPVYIGIPADDNVRIVQYAYAYRRADPAFRDYAEWYLATNVLHSWAVVPLDLAQTSKSSQWGPVATQVWQLIATHPAVLFFDYEVLCASGFFTPIPDACKYHPAYVRTGAKPTTAPPRLLCDDAEEQRAAIANLPGDATGVPIVYVDPQRLDGLQMYMRALRIMEEVAPALVWVFAKPLVVFVEACLVSDYVDTWAPVTEMAGEMASEYRTRYGNPVAAPWAHVRTFAERLAVYLRQTNPVVPLPRDIYYEVVCTNQTRHPIPAATAEKAAHVWLSWRRPGNMPTPDASNLDPAAYATCGLVAILVGHVAAGKGNAMGRTQSIALAALLPEPCERIPDVIRASARSESRGGVLTDWQVLTKKRMELLFTYRKAIETNASSGVQALLPEVRKCFLEWEMSGRKPVGRSQLASDEAEVLTATYKAIVENRLDDRPVRRRCAMCNKETASGVSCNGKEVCHFYCGTCIQRALQRDSSLILSAGVTLPCFSFSREAHDNDRITYQRHPATEQGATIRTLTMLRYIPSGPLAALLIDAAGHHVRDAQRVEWRKPHAPLPHAGKMESAFGTAEDFYQRLLHFFIAPANTCCETADGRFIYDRPGGDEMGVYQCPGCRCWACAVCTSYVLPATEEHAMRDHALACIARKREASGAKDAPVRELIRHRLGRRIVRYMQRLGITVCTPAWQEALNAALREHGCAIPDAADEDYRLGRAGRTPKNGKFYHLRHREAMDKLPKERY